MLKKFSELLANKLKSIAKRNVSNQQSDDVKDRINYLLSVIHKIDIIKYNYRRVDDVLLKNAYGDIEELNHDLMMLIDVLKKGKYFDPKYTPTTLITIPLNHFNTVEDRIYLVPVTYDLIKHSLTEIKSLLAADRLTSSEIEYFTMQTQGLMQAIEELVLAWVEITV